MNESQIVQFSYFKIQSKIQDLNLYYSTVQLRLNVSPYLVANSASANNIFGLEGNISNGLNKTPQQCHHKENAIKGAVIINGVVPRRTLPLLTDGRRSRTIMVVTIGYRMILRS